MDEPYTDSFVGASRVCGGGRLSVAIGTDYAVRIRKLPAVDGRSFRQHREASYAKG
jgi:hypothetical protein